MLTILQITAYLVIAVTVFTVLVGIYYGLRSVDKGLRKQGVYLVIAALSQIIFQVFAMHRYTDSGVEIFCSLSIITLFFVLDTNYLGTMGAMKIDDTPRRGMFITINITVLYILAMSVLVHVFMGYNTSYYNWADALQAFAARDLDILMRAAVFGGVIIFSAEIFREIAVAYLQVRKELDVNNARRHSLIRWAMVDIAWALIITLMGIGEFVTEAWYHIGVELIILVMMANTVWGYIRFCRMARSKAQSDDEQPQERPHNQKTGLAIEQWIGKRPFPLRENLSMEAIAKASGLSRDDLSDYIYNELGLTFTAWVRDCRLDHCRDLLTNTDMTISQIADETGYNELAALSKAFKQKYGIPPSKFKRK